MENEEMKRLFFGVEVISPWPEELPSGRLVPPESRHLTLAFLGKTSLTRLEAERSDLPDLHLPVGIVGIFDALLFLPERHPRVVAWHVAFCDESGPLFDLQKRLDGWLTSHSHPVDERPLLPHVTMARSPFYPREWKRAFQRLPLMITALHLYESKGSRTYETLWSFPFPLPFEPLSHTADLAFDLRGATLADLGRHAEIALAFEFPPLVNYLEPSKHYSSLDEVIVGLNALVARADAEIGAPFKAISFHGEVRQEKNALLHWEMIVDV